MNLTKTLSTSMSRVAIQTYWLLAVSIPFTIFGVLLGPAVPSSGAALVLFLLALGLIFIASPVSRKWPIIGCLLFLTFATVMGASIAPMIAKYMATGTGQAAIIKSLVATGGIFIGLSAWTWIKGFDAGSWGPYLFAALLGLLLVMILSLFFPTSFSQTMISCAAVVLFSLYIVYDTSELVHGREDNPVMAAIGLYLDVLNIFVHLLRIFGSSSDD